MVLQNFQRSSDFGLSFVFFSFSVFNNPVPSACIGGDDLGGEGEGLRWAPGLVL